MLEAVADVPAKLGARAAQHAVGIVARVRIVALRVAAHDGLALLVAGSALAARTL